MLLGLNYLRCFPVFDGLCDWFGLCLLWGCYLKVWCLAVWRLLVAGLGCVFGSLYVGFPCNLAIWVLDYSLSWVLVFWYCGLFLAWLVLLRF